MSDKTLRRKSKRNFYIMKWLLFISVGLVAGGLLAFGAILLTAYLIGDSVMNPLWIVGMIPLMAIVAVPITFIVYRQIKKNLTVLLSGMEEVANGNLEVYIPTAHARDFASVYENFNKMVGEIQSGERLRTDMLDLFSHELKTPVSSIGGFSDMLLTKDLPEEKRRQYLEIIKQESDRLANLIQNVLLISKLDAQEIVPHKEKYNLAEQIQNCVISVEKSWSDKNIDMSAELDNITYNGNEEMMKSLWLNLINNAVKYTPDGGRISITLKGGETGITFSVEDSGIGMSEEVLKHIFERRYRADNKSLSGGQGLGLSIAKRIAVLCGGSITVTSKENEGSCFTVKLPNS